MDVRLRLPDDRDGGELKQLYNWLTMDQELRGAADMALGADQDPTPDPADDEPGTSMGGAFDIIELVLDSGIQLGSLAVAIVAWRQAQRSRSSVEVRRGPTRIVILPPDADPEQLRHLLRQLDTDDTSTSDPAADGAPTDDTSANGTPEDGPR